MSTELNEENERDTKSIIETVNLVDAQYRYKLDEYKQYWRTLMYHSDPKPVERNGYYLSPGFEFDTAQYAYDKLKLGEGDVVVATYPKTGTTWVASIVANMFAYNKPELQRNYVTIDRMFSYLGYGPVSKYVVSENLPFKRRTFITHLPSTLVNLKKYRENGVKMIYVIRNPKDQVVSWYNFAKKTLLGQSVNWKHIYPEEEARCYDIAIAGKQLVFSKEGEGYLEHVRSWYKHKNDPNMHWLVYEDLKKKPRKEIFKLAQFLGESPSEDELESILEKTSFSSMRKRAEDNPFETLFFRKGEIGDWRNHLSDEQSEAIDRKVEEILGDTDIKFTYE